MLRKALIVGKLSRFEFEQLRYPELNAVQLERKIRDRGTDYDSLISYNDQHVEFRKQVVECFQRNKVEVKVVDRSVDDTQWMVRARVLITPSAFADCPSTERRSIGPMSSFP